MGGASQTGIRVTLGGTGVGVVTSGGNTGGYFYGSDYGVVGEASSGIAGQFYGATYATDNMVRTSGISGISTTEASSCSIYGKTRERHITLVRTQPIRISCPNYAR